MRGEGAGKAGNAEACTVEGQQDDLPAGASSGFGDASMLGLADKGASLLPHG